MPEDFNADYFSGLAANANDQKSQEARRSVIAASDSNPDLAARASDVSKELSVPQRAVEKDLSFYEREKNFNADYFSEIGKKYPSMLDFVSDPDNASIVHDDLSYLENTGKALGSMGRAFGVGATYDVTSGIYGAIEVGSGVLSDVIGKPADKLLSYMGADQGSSVDIFGAVSEIAKRGQIATQSQSDINTEILSKDSNLAINLLTSASRSVGTTLTGTVGSVLTGNPAIALSSMGTVTGGSAMADAKRQGLSNADSLKYGILQGGVEVATEAMPMFNLIKDLDAGSGFFKLIANQMIAEVPGEQVATLLQDFIEYSTLNERGITFQEYLNSIPASQAFTLGSTVIAVGMQTGAVQAINRASRGKREPEPNPNEVASYIKNVGKAIADKNGKLMGRSKPKMREYIEKTTGDKTFYLDAEVVSTLYQSMTEEQQQEILNAIPDFEASLDQAVNTLDSFEIPAADFFTYIQPNDTENVLDEYVTFAPEHYSAADIREVDEMISDLIEQADQAQQEMANGDVVENNIYQQLLQTFNGRKAPSGRIDVARMMAQNPRAFYETLLERTENNPQVKEILDRLIRDVTIQREVPNLKRVLKVENIDLDIDRVRERAKRRAKAEQKANEQPADMFGNKKKKRKGKAKPTPIISWLGKRAGIRATGTMARELAAMDITPKTHPRLFSSKGLGAVDNIPTEEFNAEIGNDIGLIAPPNEAGYVDPNWLIEQIRNESFGEGALTQQQQQDEADQKYLDDIEQVMQMVGVDIDMENAQIKDELSAYSKRLQNEFDGAQDTLYQFAGRKSETADLTKLDEAQARLNNGEDAETIRYDTGWFKGKDNKWRYEIDDSKASLNVDPDMLVDGGSTTLGIFFNHDKLYKSYPNIEDNIQVVVDSSIKTKAGYGFDGASKKMAIFINPERLKGEKEIISGLSHEIQHVIQDIEGFDGGGKASDIIKALKKQVSDAKEELKHYKEGKDNKERKRHLEYIASKTPETLLREAHIEYLALPGEVEARNTQSRLNLPELGRKIITPESTETRYNKDSAESKQEAIDKNSSLFFQGTDQAPRGSIQFLPDGKAIINLFEKEDLSTFMHEAGHLYWRAMSEIAAIEGIPDQIKKDVATIRNWVGAEDGATLSVEQEEKIADGFLSYIRKGEAPSVDLQSAFGRMKAWFVRIYRGVRDSLPKINKDVKEVFDRMLATDDAIENVQAEPSFNIDPVILGLLPKVQADRMQKKFDKALNNAKERLLKKAIKQAERKATKTYKKERATIRARITKEVMEERAYSTMAMITENGGISKKGIAQVLNKEAVKYLSGHGLVKRGGVHPDIIADMTSYRNGYEMIMEFMNTPKLKARIDELTDQAMLERYGDMMQDGSINDEAMRIYHNNLRKEVIVMEMQAMNELSGVAGPTKESIEAAALKLVGDLPVGKLQANRYLRAENKAFFEYGKALGQDNFARAAKAKSQQLLNHHLYNMVIDARSTVDKSVKGWNKFARPDKKIAKSRGINIDYVYAIRAILARHGIGKSDYPFRDWFDQLTLENPDSAQSLAQLINMNSEGAKPYKDLSVGEFMGLKDAVDGIVQLGRDVLTTEIEGQKLTTREASERAADSIYDNGKVRNVKHYENIIDKSKEFVSGFDKVITRMEFILKALDGNKLNGVLAQMFMNPLQEAENNEELMMREVSEKLKNIIEKNTGVRTRWRQKITDARLDDTFTVRNVITIALNMGNEGNLEKMLDGYNWEYADVKALIERTLTKEDMDTVQEIWDLMETLRPDLQRVHKEVNGFPMEIVKSQPVETKWGTYRGGYFPVVYDVKRSDIGARNAEKVSVFESNFIIPSVGKGMTKGRSTFTGPVDLNFDAIVSSHLSKTIHLITHGAAVKDLNRIIMQDNFKKAVIEVAGTETYSKFKPWLQAVASNSVYDSPVEAHDKVIRHLRVATTQMFLGFSVSTGVKQTLGMTASYASVLRGEVTQRNFWKANRQYFTDPANASKFILESSVFMQSRIRKMDANIATVMAGVSKLNTTYDKVMYAGMAGMGYSQLYTVDMPTWMAGYNEGMEQYNDHDKAVNMADTLVRQTQGSGAVKDLSTLQRGNETQKAAWTMFGTFMIGVLYPKLRELGIDVSKGHVLRSIFSLTSLLFIPAVLEGLMSSPPEDDESWLEWMLVKNISYGASSVPIAGGFVNAYLEDYGYSMSATETPIDMFMSNIKSDDPDKFAKGFAVGVGVVTKLPVYKPYLALDELIDQASGEEDLNVIELLQLRRDSDR